MVRLTENHHKILLIATIIGIILFPVLLVVINGRILQVDFTHILPNVFQELFNESVVLDFLIGASFVFISITIMFFSVTLLFNVEIPPTLVSDKNHMRLKKVFNHLVTSNKRVSHLLLGYFLSILAFHPLIAIHYSEVHQNENLLTYQVYGVTLFLICIALFSARLLSKTKLTILDNTNIGIFIIIVYISEFLYETISFGLYPSKLVVNMVYDTNVKNIAVTLQIFAMEIIMTFIVTAFDWFIIKKVLHGKL